MCFPSLSPAFWPYVAYARLHLSIYETQIFDFFRSPSRFASQFMWLFVCVSGMCMGGAIPNFCIFRFHLTTENRTIQINVCKSYSNNFSLFWPPMQYYKHASTARSRKNRFRCKIWQSIAKFMRAILLGMVSTNVCIADGMSRWMEWVQNERNGQEQW